MVTYVLKSCKNIHRTEGIFTNVRHFIVIYSVMSHVTSHLRDIIPKDIKHSATLNSFPNKFKSYLLDTQWNWIHNLCNPCSNSAISWFFHSYLLPSFYVLNFLSPRANESARNSQCSGGSIFFFYERKCVFVLQCSWIFVPSPFDPVFLRTRTLYRKAFNPLYTYPQAFT